ncbi:hypothetical protein Pmani_018197 [Petrolisthes manimaculis]|uniref:Uncharacterized protein n=1 Tax=Petrolisthes manimaculis TaxID=1843537 RepID=A0AAE1U4R3_9EUCA|nr:hypothetical protein Pmani_018197 [Petrolisthes manimaculis]
MTDDRSNTNQNTALRDKFVSVVGPVFAGGDEGNILTLLTSLTGQCHHHETLGHTKSSPLCQSQERLCHYRIRGYRSPVW